MVEAAYQETTITTIHEYVELVIKEKQLEERFGNKSDLLFRGQRKDWELLPKLGRIRLRGEIQNIEDLIIEEFKRKSLPLTEFKPEDDWDVLALAQHHGLPTRLLDWTYSALAGLWFAVRETPSINKVGNSEHGVVWILKAHSDDFRLKTDRIGPFDIIETKIFRSKIISRRISAQGGVFTAHVINENEQMIRFELHETFSAKLVKVKVPPERFSRIRKGLNILGVNSSMIFPDLDGLCKHLEWRYSFYEDEDKSDIDD